MACRVGVGAPKVFAGSSPTPYREVPSFFVAHPNFNYIHGGIVKYMTKVVPYGASMCRFLAWCRWLRRQKTHRSIMDAAGLRLAGLRTRISLTLVCACLVRLGRPTVAPSSLAFKATSFTTNMRTSTAYKVPMSTHVEQFRVFAPLTAHDNLRSCAL